jgi:hypothetical protein
MLDIHLILDEWRPVVGFERLYEVSSSGLVRSMERDLPYSRVDQYSGRTLHIIRRRRSTILRPAPGVAGQMTVVLGRGNTRNVSVLVAEAFHGPAPAGHECRHMDGDVTNDRADNLRWVTRAEALALNYASGVLPRGSRRWNAKLDESLIPQIRNLIGKLTYTEIGERFGVSESVVRSIRDGKTWSHA